MFSDWVQDFSYGGLTKPTTELNEKVPLLNLWFEEFRKDKIISNAPNVSLPNFFKFVC